MSLRARENKDGYESNASEGLGWAAPRIKKADWEENLGILDFSLFAVEKQVLRYFKGLQVLRFAF